jgi:hypothetical protein
MSSKTFRLFVSSTFDDFRKEREILQAVVFPMIKEHCAEIEYIFQPIDLRWGINNEAQLNQKTLELCLNEVRSCKTFPHPNFLIMIGDRYGWVPLPYKIEKSEFERLLQFMDQQEKELVESWYQEDLNELPASYILKERDGGNASHEVWSPIEKALLTSLQQAATKAGLNENQIRKYVVSATEAEVTEGIFSYAGADKKSA